MSKFFSLSLAMIISCYSCLAFAEMTHRCTVDSVMPHFNADRTNRVLGVKLTCEKVTEEVFLWADLGMKSPLEKLRDTKKSALITMTNFYFGTMNRINDNGDVTERKDFIPSIDRTGIIKLATGLTEISMEDLPTLKNKNLLLAYEKYGAQSFQVGATEIVLGKNEQGEGTLKLVLNSNETKINLNSGASPQLDDELNIHVDSLEVTGQSAHLLMAFMRKFGIKEDSHRNFLHMDFMHCAIAGPTCYVSSRIK